jgi:hypothetical protein
MHRFRVSSLPLSGSFSIHESYLLADKLSVSSSTTYSNRLNDYGRHTISHIN